jgi:hypothetical protein
MSRHAGPRRPLWQRSLSWALLAVALGFVVFCAGWRLEGGRWQHVETSSMGTVAPVGSLVWTTPVDFDSLRPGDFITFHPPGKPSQTYSHRVYERHSDGTITTKGVIPGPDPWRLTAADVVGKVRMTWWGAGWLVVAAPILLAGVLVTGTVHSLVRDRWKVPAVVVLSAATLCVAIVVHRPFLDADQIAFAPAATGGADATYVGTGLLPVRLTAEDGPHVDLRDGQVGVVHVATVDRDHGFRVRLQPQVPLWFWAALVLACFLPGLYSFAVSALRDRRRATILG